MKTILVIDAEMPENCDVCPLLRWSSIDGWNCTPMNRITEDDKPEWCPLKPLPNAITESGKWISEEYQKGWNAFRENLK